MKSNEEDKIIEIIKQKIDKATDEELQESLEIIENKLREMKKKKVKAPGVFIERAALCTIEGIRALCGTDEEYSEYVRKIEGKRMKTELQITKENVKLWKEVENPENLATIISHKESCQRFLDFLEDYPHFRNNPKIKIIDLKNAIKHYEENGI